MHMNILYACMYVPHVCAVPMKVEIATRSLGTEMTEF